MKDISDSFYLLLILIGLLLASVAMCVGGVVIHAGARVMAGVAWLRRRR